MGGGGRGIDRILHISAQKSGKKWITSTFGQVYFSWKLHTQNTHFTKILSNICIHLNSETMTTIIGCLCRVQVYKPLAQLLVEKIIT